MITRFESKQAIPTAPPKQAEAKPEAPMRDRTADLLVMLPDAIKDAVSAMPPVQVVVQTPPRLNEWVFTVNRSKTEKREIESINASGQATQK